MSPSYESKMLDELSMPSKQEVQEALLVSLFNHHGTIREFAAGEEIVNEIAVVLHLNELQRTAQLETIYRKESRLKKSLLWHRLLFRAADDLAKHHLVLKPSQTVLLTGRKEWLLTENGYDRALILLGISQTTKSELQVQSYEVELVTKELIELPRPKNYSPFEQKRIATTTREYSIRSRGFRQAVLRAYDYRCCVCGLKIATPDGKAWEAQAAHIVPHSANGKDDIFNGISLCHLHHWAFDAGWFSFQNHLELIVCKKRQNLSDSAGKFYGIDIFGSGTETIKPLCLPARLENYPHEKALAWHRENIFIT